MTTFSDKAWDGSASNYSDTNAYCDASFIDDNPSGQPKKQALCKLPYKEPGGAVNKNALKAVEGALMGARGSLVAVSPATKKQVARKVLALMNEAKMTPGDGLKKLAQ